MSLPAGSAGADARDTYFGEPLPVAGFALVVLAAPELDDADLVVAAVGTLAVFFILWVAANENSPYCMIPHWCGHTVDADVETYKKNMKSLFGA